MTKTATRKVTVRPLDDRVLVKQDDAETKTAGGIVLPDSAQDKPTRGTIIAVGEGKLLKDGTRRGLSVKVGDSVIFGQYGGSNVKVDGQDHKIVRESDILGVID